MNQAQFADVLGVSQGTVSKWENGQQTPDLSTIMRIADAAGVNAMFLAFHDEEHHLVEPWRSAPFFVKGSIAEQQVESTFWDEKDYLEIAMPLTPELASLQLFAMLLKDDSAQAVFPRDTIVILTKLIQEKIDVKNGDLVLVSEVDSSNGLRRNVLGVWSKQRNEYPILAGVSEGKYRQPGRIAFRDKVDLFAQGGYEAVGVMGMVVGSICVYQQDRFPKMIKANSEFF